MVYEEILKELEKGGIMSKSDILKMIDEEIKKLWEKVGEIDVEVRDIKGRLEQLEAQCDTYKDE